jgi:hypothetical protein
VRGPALSGDRDDHVAVGTDGTRAEGDPSEGLVVVTIVRGWRGLVGDGRRRGRGRSEELPASRECLRAVPMAKPAVVADAVKTARQDVQEKAPEFLMNRFRFMSTGETAASSTLPSVTRKWRCTCRLIRSPKVWMAAMTPGVSALRVTTST